MIASDVIDFFMEQLVLPGASPQKIRQTIKDLAGMSRNTSLGRRMLTGQLIDILFDLYDNGLTDATELGRALKSKLNRYGYSQFMPARQAGVIVPMRKTLKAAGR